MSTVGARRDRREDEQVRVLFTERARTGLGWLSVSFVVFLITDLVQAPSLITSLAPVKLVQLVGIVGAWTALHLPGGQRHPIPVVLLMSAIYAATVSAQGVLRDDLVTAALSLTSVVFAASVMLPAGARFQGGLVVIGAISLLSGIYVSTGELAMAVTLPALTLWATAIASVMIAHQRMRYEARSEHQQRALRASEERLRLVLDATNDGVWDWNIETGEVNYSPRWLESLGYVPAEVPPHVSFWESLVHPEDMPRVQSALQDHFEGKTRAYECETRLLTKSGAWRPYLDRGKVVERTGDGKPLRMIGTETDISERTRRQDEMAALLAVSQDISGTVDRFEIMERVQTHAAAALGSDRVSVSTYYWDRQRRVFRQFSQVGIAPRFLQAAAQIEFNAQSDLIANFIGQFVAGETIVIDAETPQSEHLSHMLKSFDVTALAAAPLRVHERHLGALVAFLSDTPRLAPTQVKLLEAMARQLAVALEAAELYERERERAEEETAMARVGQELIASLDIPVLLGSLCRITSEILGCDFSHTFLYQPVNAVFQAVAGFGDPPDKWEQLRQSQMPRAFVQTLVERLEKGAVVQVGKATSPELMPEGLQAAYGITHALFVPLRRGSEIVGVHTAGYRGREQPFPRSAERVAARIADMASLALQNARLVEELDRANAVKADFVASMSHELRNPLNILIGYHDLLLDGAFDPLTEKQEEIVRRLLHQSRELLNLINATLDLSGLDAGRIPLRWDTVDAAALVAVVAREGQPHGAEPRIRVTSQALEPLPHLQTDAAKLKLVLSNLLSNALKFTAEGEITITARPRQGGIEFAVADTGIGIAPDALQRIFEPFQQADTTISARFGGVGLGLHIVRRLVNLLGGVVAVESEIGRGSVFRIWLPIQPEGATAEVGKEARPVGSVAA